MNWLMIALTIVVGICVIWGWYRGMVKMIMAVGTLLLSLVVSLVVAPYVQNLVCQHTTIDEKVVERCGEVIERKLENAGASEDAEIFSLFDKITGQENTQETITETIKTELANSIGNTIVKWGVFIATALILWIAFHIVMWILDLVAKLPILNGLNHLIGALLGLVQGFLIVWMILMVIECFPQIDFFATCAKLIEESQYLKILQEWNLFSIILLR